jgi:hypothetical protein
MMLSRNSIRAVNVSEEGTPLFRTQQVNQQEPKSIGESEM